MKAPITNLLLCEVVNQVKCAGIAYGIERAGVGGVLCATSGHQLVAIVLEVDVLDLLAAEPG